MQPSPPLGGEGGTAQPDGERGDSADDGAYAHPSGIAHGSCPLSPGPSPPEGGEGRRGGETLPIDLRWGGYGEENNNYGWNRPKLSKSRHIFLEVIALPCHNDNKY